MYLAGPSKGGSLFYFAVIFVVFFGNISLISLYTDGDLYYYRNFYSHAAKISLWDVPQVQLRLLSSGEPLYGFLFWIFAKIKVPHDVLIAALNTVLFLTIWLICKKYQASRIFLALTFTNYYFLVLLTGAERLKVAFILISLAALVESRITKFILAALAPLAHVQMIVHVAAVALPWLRSYRSNVSFSTKLLLATACILSFAAAIFMGYSYGGVIYAKFLYYSAGQPPISNILKLLGVLVIGVIALPQRSQFLFAMLVLMVATYFVGSDRFQISALALLGYCAVMQDRSWHPAILAIMAYFSFKSISFIVSVFEYGHGFGHVVESVLNR